MNITLEQSNNLTGVIKISLTPDDYKQKYESALKSYSRKVNIKGFRPGHVPITIVKKMYGKSILAEEINNLLNEVIYKYIDENKLQVLGNPMPKEDSPKVNFDENAGMDFWFELGFAPEIKFDLSDYTITYNALKVDEELINKQINDYTRRAGKLENTDVSTEKDMLLGTFAELDENETLKEGGIVNQSTISLEFLDDKQTQQALVGLKPGDSITVDPRNLSHGDADMAAMLGIEKQRVAEVKSKFRFTVNEIKKMVPAELNQELFNRIYGEGVVTTEEDFRKRIENDLKNMFTADSDRLFYREVKEQLLNKINIELPDDFLKRWILATNEKPITHEQLDKEYPEYAKMLRWQLIENKIAKDNNISVNPDEALQYAKSYLASAYARYGLPPMEETELTQNAMRLLANKEDSKRIYDDLAYRKVLDYLKANVPLDIKEYVYDEFVKLFATNQSHHNHEHDHEHHHEHEHEHH
jgi:trigger factor